MVLCLLDVARIAYVKYGFTEAPGLVKFEQEIDRELANEAAQSGSSVLRSHARAGYDDGSSKVDQVIANNKRLALARGSAASIGDATDELVMRYCRHKEEEAARKRLREEEEEEEKLAEKERQQLREMEELKRASETPDKSVDSLTGVDPTRCNSFGDESGHQNNCNPMEPDSLMPIAIGSHQPNGVEFNADVSSSTDFNSAPPPISNGKNFMADHGRVESLDSGEGPTESAASTVHSSVVGQTYDAQANARSPEQTNDPSPTPASQPTTTTTTTTSTNDSELSSSRSSLLSNQDCNNSTSNYGRQITSELDGKVMHIAKSYYGKRATRDVTRLSEGKYKIADRIVFVRLLKEHRVMVRIGGGWDTLENFLFRHKSDPTQVIDPDNLLPLETKISLENSAQLLPRGTPIRSPARAQLSNYRRSNSASSTNLSMTNLSYSNLSLASSQTNTPLRQVPVSRARVGAKNAVHFNSSLSVDQTPRRQIPRLLVHKGQVVSRTPRINSQPTGMTPNNPSPSKRQSYVGQQQQQQQGHKPALVSAQATSTSYSSPYKSALKKPQAHYSSNPVRSPHNQQRFSNAPTTLVPKSHPQNNIITTRSIHLHRPVASSQAPTNLYPATLTTTTTTAVASAFASSSSKGATNSSKITSTRA